MAQFWLLLINARSKKILDGLKLVMKGLLFVVIHHKRLQIALLKLTEKIITTHLNRKYVDWSLLKSDLKDRIGKSIYSQVKKE